MPTFKQLLDICTGAEMDMLCARYEGFSRFAHLLERLAKGCLFNNLGTVRMCSKRHQG